MISIRSCTARLLLVFSVWLTGCSNELPDHADNTAGSTQHPKPDQIQQQETHSVSPNTQLAEHFLHLYAQAWAQSKQLEKAVQGLIDAPEAHTIEIAQQQWRQTHDAYLLASIADLLKMPHPVLDMTQNTPEVIHSARIRIDQHPIIPGYLDSVAGYPISGLMNAETPINFETLNAEHQFSDQAYVTLGFHALEFMLFGDPEIENPRFEDFLSSENKEDELTAKTAQRRLAYIRLLAGQLRKDLRLYVDAWSAPEGFYRNYVTVMRSKDLAETLTRALKIESEHNKNSMQPAHMPAEIRARRQQELNMLNALFNLHTPEETGETDT